MKTEINLLQGDLIPKRILLDAKQGLLILCLTVASVFAMLIPQVWNHWQIKMQWQNINYSVAVNQQLIQKWQTSFVSDNQITKTTKNDEPQDQTYPESIHKKPVTVNEILAQGHWVYSDLLFALARHSNNDVLLTNIELNQRLNSLAISGRGLSPESITNYIERLSGDVVFSGKKFNKIRVARSQQAQQYEFELSSSNRQ